jgi:ABC-type uncharacterized transport system ATPase subunit
MVPQPFMQVPTLTVAVNVILGLWSHFARQGLLTDVQAVEAQIAEIPGATG